jgi:L-ascorbate metabolism protein UlaG (beta-lactamase superfamily)
VPDQLTYVGHSTLLVELGGVRILTDPVLRERIAHIRRRVPAPSVEELLPLDAVLISHAHADHLDVPSLRRVAGAKQVIAPLGCAATIRRAGADRVVELTVGGTCAVGPVGVEAVPAEHDGRRHPLGPRIPSLGFLLDGPTRIYFAGDTDLFDGMARLAGRVDVALLPVAGWGPRLPPGHLDPESAARAAALIRPSVAVPIHWGTMRSVGARPDPDPRRPALAFAAAVEEHAPETAVRILMPGETMSLAPAR